MVNKDRTIRNLADLADALGVDATGSVVDKIKRSIYKNTECGAWINLLPTGVAVGSIVEGAEQCTGVTTLHYPFQMSVFDSVIEDIEREADDIWMATHGCEDCYPGEEPGPVNPDCKTCGGKGVVV